MNDEWYPLTECGFSVSYMHSVNQSKVTEIFEARQGQIVLTALEFETFGAGMPVELELGQVLTRLPGGVMRIDGFDRVIDDMRFLIGRDTKHMLHIGDLSVYLEPGQAIFSIKRRID